MEIVNRSSEMSKRMSKLTEEATISDLQNDLFQKTNTFIGHVKRVSNQYETQRKLKENLRNGHIAVHMDFAEDYSCRSQDEVQTAYLSLAQVTRPLVVACYIYEDFLKHKCIVFISDEPRHDENFVLVC